MNVSIVGSVDGELATVDAVPLITSTGSWFNGTMEWDSTAATIWQDIAVVLSVENSGSTPLQFIMDSLDLQLVPVVGTVILVY